MRRRRIHGRDFIPTIDERILLEKLDLGYRKLAQTDSTRLPLAHESVPEPTIYIDGKPAYVISRNASTKLGEEALEEILNVSTWIHGLLKGFYGPRKMLKLYHDDGMFFTLSSIESLARRIEIENPVAQLMIGAGLSVHREMGDAGVYTSLLSAALVRNLVEAALNGVPQSEILRSLIEILPIVKKYIRKLSKLPRDGVKVSKILELSVFNKLPTPLQREFLKISEKIVSILGVKRILSTPLRDLIDVRYVIDVSEAFSEVVEGVAFPKEIPHPAMPKTVENAKIAILKGELKLPQKIGRFLKISYEIDSSIRDGFQGKDSYLKSFADDLLKLGVNVLVVEKGVDEHVLEYLARKGVLVVRRFSPPELDLLSKAVGARPSSIASGFSYDSLGWAEKVYERKIHGKHWIFFERPRNSEGVTVLLRGFSTESLYDLEGVLMQAVKLRALLEEENAYLYGGGAFEEDLYQILSEKSYTLADKRQLVLLSIANSFEEIPWILAANSGMDSQETVLRLRKLHAEGRSEMGVEGFAGKVADMGQEEVLDPASIKAAAIETAFETAYTILRIDGIIRGRKLSESEYYYVKRMRGMEKMKRMKRDYGVESLE